MRRPRRPLIAALALLPALGLDADMIRVDLKTCESFEAAARDRFIAVDRDPPGIRLARSYLVTNETGVIGKFFDSFGDRDSAKIRFDIPIPGFEKGLLLFYISYRENHPQTIAFNGRARPYAHDEARMLTGGWARHDVPAEELKAGANEVVFSGVGGGLYVDTYSHSGKSSRTFDGGATWKPDALGPDGSWSGEYIARLRVYGHPPAGEVTGAVIDAAAWPTDPKIRPQAAVHGLTLRADQDTPAGTRIDFAVRSGATPTVAGNAWGNWKPIQPGESLSLPGHRYVQWRAALKTDDSRRTPAIRGLRLELQADVTRPSLDGIRVDAYDNPPLRCGSYPFVWETDTPRVRRLRDKYRLFDVVREAPDELTRQNVLRRWVSGRWDNGWHMGKYTYCPPWDALELLEMAPGYLSKGMCTHYSCTYVQTAASVGFNVRSLIVDHHCLTEAWSNQLGKWVLQDPGPGPGPEGCPVGFAYQAGGEWLNALDMHRALGDKRPVTAVPYKDIKEPWTLDDKWMRLFVRFGIPLRNNHLSEPAPAEVEHGQEQYRWDGYLWWTDSVDDPTYPEYSLLSNRVDDFYAALNRVTADLQQQDASTLIVNLNTQTPNIERYEAAVDEKPWQAVTPGFSWALHDGANGLKLRTVNTFGRAGKETQIGVTKR